MRRMAHATYTLDEMSTSRFAASWLRSRWLERGKADFAGKIPCYPAYHRSPATAEAKGGLALARKYGALPVALSLHHAPGASFSFTPSYE